MPSDRCTDEIPQKHNRNGWKKYHARMDCGGETVWFIENPWQAGGPWSLYCAKCGRAVDEDEVLFINSSWYYEFEEDHGMLRLFDRLHLAPDRVLELGPDPRGEELIEAIAKQNEANERRKREHRERLKEMGAPAYQDHDDE